MGQRFCKRFAHSAPDRDPWRLAIDSDVRITVLAKQRVSRAHVLFSRMHSPLFEWAWRNGSGAVDRSGAANSDWGCPAFAGECRRLRCAGRAGQQVQYPRWRPTTRPPPASKAGDARSGPGCPELIGRAELPLGPNNGAAQQRSPTAGWFMAPIHIQSLEVFPLPAMLSAGRALPARLGGRIVDFAQAAL